MNRCFSHSLSRRGALAAAAALLLAGAASAQTNPVRIFSDATQQGVMEVIAPPSVLLNGQADRLSPGVRIRGTNNMLVLSGALLGQSFPVRYTRETNGLIHEVWILTAEEAAANYKRPSTLVGPVNPNLAPPTKPGAPRDDGKTPFDQLPKYPNQ